MICIRKTNYTDTVDDKESSWFVGVCMFKYNNVTKKKSKLSTG